MFFFSLAFSLPFFFLAVFPSFANKLQGKSGQWMVEVKAIFGFLELAAAFKFLSNVDLVWQWGLITKPAVLACWALIFFTAGLHFLSIFPLLRRDKNIRPLRPIRTFVAIAMFAFSAYAYTGIRDNRDMGGWIDSWLPPTIYPRGDADRSKKDQSWIVDDIEKGLARARKKRQPLFIDFTGYTCTNCRYMETSVFPNEKVHSRLENMVRVTAYTDCTQEICETQREMQIARYGTAALPFYVILNPFDNTVLAQFASMTTDIDQFAAFLDKGISVFEKWAGEKTNTAPEGETADPFRNISVNLNKSDHQVDFRFPSLEDKKPTALSSLRGKWILLNFWASWCSPCKKEFKEAFPPALASAPHITLVTVAFDGDDTRAAALKIAREERLTEQVALQGGEDITEAGLEAAFDVSPSLPISYLIRPNGTIAWMRKGSVSKELLTRLFAKTKPGTAHFETPATRTPQ
jgi:thiol:disulfide interchange protein DsbD